ncbi:MAG: proline dehydrogenase family protein [Bacteroidetes bacterium]|nr:MAG: proline dehydrogenase [Cryomorphaceae bacterium BACL29 MAG-121220-bin8]MDA0757993.1 proline dehydrogenase family protein [Bacteroidota bacterium]MDA1019219.1 proline dehydrogenase family protein [Bacteroidota bacterium]
MNNIFSNTKEAFSLKTNFELLRAQFLFKIIQNRTLVKVSTFLTNFALKFYLPVTPIIKMTVFNHFCGGVSELDCNPVIKKMYEKKVSSVLDFSTEAFNSEVEFDNCYDKKISIIEFIKHRPEIPFAVFKPTCLGSVDLFKKKTKGEDLNYEENLLWIKVVERFEGVCQKAHDNDIKILIDAEEVFVQKAIDDLALLMMLKFNRKKSIIFNTVQMYRWDRLEYLNNLLKDKSNKDVIFGFKLVRGAYMEKERLIAKSLNIKSPICSSKKETDINFNSGLDFIFKNLERISLVCASHNEDSVIKVMDFIKKRNIKFSDDKIWFGQLYGMSDNITFNLANMGYNSFKILPFGPVRNLMPYLIRRAEENTSVEGQTGRELQLIINEKNRRAIEKS